MTKICPNCKKEILDNAKKCKWCKQWIRDKKSSSAVKILAVAVSCFLAVVFIFFIFVSAIFSSENNSDETYNKIQNIQKVDISQTVVIKGKEITIKDVLFNEYLRKMHNHVITEFKLEKGILNVSFAGSNEPFEMPLSELSSTMADDGDDGYIVLIKNLKNNKATFLYLHKSYLSDNEIKQILNILQTEEISIFAMLKNMFKELKNS